MGKRRRKDKNHDVGDSMPGTVGDSNGTIHDGQDGATFNPEDETVTEPSSSHSRQQEKGESTENDDNGTSESDKELVDSEEKSTRMKYAEKYGNSWPEDRKRRFLEEHDVSASELGWKLKE
jgi:hypothetical protein